MAESTSNDRETVQMRLGKGLLNEKMEPSLCHCSMTYETAPSLYAPGRLRWN